jgi:type III secretion protein U
MKEQSEHKSLPASDKKLRDARRKGQVSSSRDLISGFSLLAVVIYLLFTWTFTRDHILHLVEVVANSYNQPFADSWREAATTASAVVLYTVIPAVAILVLSSIVVGMIGTFGPVFSFETVKPKFDHINPASGLQRIFSMRNAVEFLKGLVKVVAVTVALWLVLRNFLQPILETPSCGEFCIAPVLLEAMKPIIVVTLMAFIIIGFFDVILQRWLFLHDMRMTKTEMKRERKDMEGDPQIRSERQRMRRMLGYQATRLGIKHATVVIASGDGLGAVRYHRQHTPIPTVVAKGLGPRAQEMRAEAMRLGIPVIEDSTLAVALARKHRPGDILKRELFAPVAGILVRQGLV